MDFLIVSKEISIFSIFAWGFLGGTMFAVLVMLIFDWVNGRSHSYRNNDKTSEVVDVKEYIIRRISKSPAGREVSPRVNVAGLKEANAANNLSI